MNQNHVIIGLGGTGGKIIQSMRKTIYQNHRTVEPEHVNLRFLYMDTDASLMKSDDESWKTLGQSVQLPQQGRLHIGADGMNLASVLDDVNNYPGIKPWIGDRKQWDGIIGSAAGAKIAGGQKRRLGRFLFANKVHDFKNALTRTVNEMTSGGQSGVTFHVCCGLAGGTGGGTVVDVVSQIRSQYGDSGQRKVFIYALLPEREPDPNWAGPNYHANGYAALRELNALAVNAWRPHDISGEKVRTSDFYTVSERLHIQDPFNVCYIFTDENAANYTVKVTNGLLDVAASFLYHKIVTAASIGSWDVDSPVARMERYEMVGGARGVEGEREYDDGSPTRSARFYTFGIKQLAYPEEEILEYLVGSFAEQAALQLRYNNWSEAIGYADEPRQQSFDAYIKDKDRQGRWKITESHLTLSEGILEDEVENSRWKPLSSEWSSAASNYLLLVQQSGSPTEQWADELARRFEKRYTDEFRGEGVQTFYNRRRKLLKRYATSLRAGIEKDLFTVWMNGEQSMQELGQMLDDLRRELEDGKHGLKAMEKKVSKQQEVAENYLEKANANDREWAKVGMFGKFVFSKYEKLLKAKASNLEHHYLARTRAEAYSFARDLLAALINDLDDLAGQVAAASSTLTQAVDYFRAMIASRLNDSGEEDLKQQIVRFYDPVTVRSLSEMLVRDKDTQIRQARQMRERIGELVGGGPTFSKLNQNVSLGHLVDVFQEQGQENVIVAHDAARAEGTQPVLGISIIDRLYDRFGTDEDRLKLYFERILRQAQTFAKFNSEERGKQVPNKATMFETFTCILPESDRHPDFVARMQKAIREAAPPGVMVTVLPSSGRENEIVILNVASSIPLRFFDPVNFLREKYERLKASSSRAEIELHTEGTGEDFPSLYQPDQSVTGNQSRPYLLLAKTTGVITVKKNQSGKPVLIYEIRDADGLLEASVQLGPDLSEAEKQLNPELAARLKETVEQRLQQDEYHPVDARKALFQKVIAEANDVSGNGEQKAYGDAAREAKQLLHLA